MFSLSIELLRCTLRHNKLCKVEWISYPSILDRDKTCNSATSMSHLTHVQSCSVIMIIVEPCHICSKSIYLSILIICIFFRIRLRALNLMIKLLIFLIFLMPVTEGGAEGAKYYD